jgi:hypothetical protein
MHQRLSRSNKSPISNLRFYVVRILVLLLPSLILFFGCLRYEGRPNLMLWLGTAFQVLVCCLSFLSGKTYRQAVGPSVITLYVIALGWLWLGTANIDDWYPSLAQAILLMVPLLFFAYHMLMDSGAPAVRRARVLAQRLAARKEWPADLPSCQTLPEVKAFREALHLDATPALELLNHNRPEVRVAALAALEFRTKWSSGQSERVLHVAQNVGEPTLRAAALMALGNVSSASLLESMAEFLRDPSAEVRHAAQTALLWDLERRWKCLRMAMRRALADSVRLEDGPMRLEGHLLPEEAVVDLKTWSAEKGLLSTQSIQMLTAHCTQWLNEKPEEALEEIRGMVLDQKAPSNLRLELARLLQKQGDADRDLLEVLLASAQATPLRLLAVGGLLRLGEHPEAVAALRDLAHLPNREIALAAAEVVQDCLAVDMGLTPGQPLPPLHSRQASEVARRVLAWASNQEIPEAPEMPKSRAIL